MLQIKIKTETQSCDCSIAITDTTKEQYGFTLESENPLTNKDFRRSDGVFIDSIFLYGEEPRVIHSSVFDINTVDIPNMYLPVTFDGFVNISRIFIITKAYLNTLPIGYFNGSYVYFDEEELTINLVEDKKVKEIDLIDLITNSIEYGVSKDEDALISICNLKQCYKKLLLSSIDFNNKVDDFCFGCLTNTNMDNLDLLYSIIKTIEFYLECKDFNSANELLQLVSKCQGLCLNNYNFYSSPKNINNDNKRCCN